MLVSWKDLLNIVVIGGDILRRFFGNGNKVDKSFDVCDKAKQEKLIIEARDSQDKAERKALEAKRFLEIQKVIAKKIQVKRDEWNSKLEELFQFFPKAGFEIQREVSTLINDVYKGSMEWRIIDIGEVNLKLEEEFSTLTKNVAQKCRDALKDIHLDTKSELECIQQKMEEIENTMKIMTNEEREQRIKDCETELSILKTLDNYI